MFNTIAILGLGTLGGFVAKALTSLETTKNLMVVDHDIVEQKNLVNSIYTEEHVGRFKVDAIDDILKASERNIKIIKVAKKFEEDSSVILGCDLIIDCRDFVYDRHNIDIRMYISGRSLVIDCRKSAEYQENHEGKYISKLSNVDLQYASFSAAMLFRNNSIDRLMDREMVHRIYLDHLCIEAEDAVVLNDTTPKMELAPNQNGEEKLINLQEYLPAIAERSKTNDMKIIVGDRSMPMAVMDVRRGELTDRKTIINSLTQIINIPIVYNSFVIAPVHGNVIELLPETGAA